MNIKKNGLTGLISEFHSNCKKVIFNALGIRRTGNSDLFISGWYAVVFFLAYGIRMLRTDINCLSVFIFLMSITLILLLAAWGMANGHLKNKIPGEKVNKQKNEEQT
ncbi:MAG: hypothetical protein ABFR36_10565 [Acidobacteriota bacterium]